MYFEATPHQPPSAPKAVFGINLGFAHGVPVEYGAASATASTPTFAVCTPRARAKYVFCVDCTSTATRRFATSTLTFTSAAATGWPRTELLRATWSALLEAVCGCGDWVSLMKVKAPARAAASATS